MLLFTSSLGLVHAVNVTRTTQPDIGGRDQVASHACVSATFSPTWSSIHSCQNHSQKPKQRWSLQHLSVLSHQVPTCKSRPRCQLWCFGHAGSLPVGWFLKPPELHQPSSCCPFPASFSVCFPHPPGFSFCYLSPFIFHFLFHFSLGLHYCPTLSNKIRANGN